MAVRIEAVKLSKNPVMTNEHYKINVTIVTHGYLGRASNSDLSAYTNGQLRLMGESVPIYAQLTAYRHSALHNMTHQQIETMEV